MIRNGNYAKLDIAVRIRQCNEKFWLTYKGPNLDSAAKIRKEIEMPLKGRPRGWANAGGSGGDGFGFGCQGCETPRRICRLRRFVFGKFLFG